MLEWIGVCLTWPYNVRVFFKNYYKHEKDVSCIKKQPLAMSGKIQARNAITISVKKMKLFAKSKKCTINDMVLALVSNILKEYFDSKNDKNVRATLQIPFTFKEIPENVDNYTYGNCFSALTLYLKLVKDMDEAITSVKALVNEQVKAIAPAQYINQMLYTTFLSASSMAEVCESVGAKHTLTLSNFQGFVKPVHYCGGLVKRFFYVGSAVGNGASLIAIISQLKRMQICISSDRS